jgi:ABC-type cobalamin/Fe3+-siderophores transport system ATPase subunit
MHNSSQADFLLRASQISVDFGGHLVLRNIDIHFPRTGLIGLAGANGSGKSTLLDVVSGFIPVSGGSLTTPLGNSLSRRQLHRLSSRLHQRVVLPDETRVSDFLAAAWSSSILGWVNYLGGNSEQFKS